MSLPGNYQPRKGDLLTLRGKVKFNVEAGDDDVHVKLIGAEHNTVIVPLSNIVDLMPIRLPHTNAETY